MQTNVAPKISTRPQFSLCNVPEYARTFDHYRSLCGVKFTRKSDTSLPVRSVITAVPMHGSFRDFLREVNDAIPVDAVGLRGIDVCHDSHDPYTLTVRIDYYGPLQMKGTTDDCSDLPTYRTHTLPDGRRILPSFAPVHSWEVRPTHGQVPQEGH